ncbi:MAG: hypothetical protein K0R54_2560 [Clostridiaceae bacterium]|jgi:putative DNA primase/helicase|nr:hypothetical protein [Clostridiaceae bacterium]
MEDINAPESLIKLKQWNTWRYEERPDEPKPAKVPYNPKVTHLKVEGWKSSENSKGCYKPEYTGTAKTNDSSTWSDFFTARDALKSGIFDGLGIMLYGNLCGIDIDNCIDIEGNPSQLAIDIINSMNSYTEVSPSGVYIESNRNYITINTVNNKQYKYKDSINQKEYELKDYGFIRTHLGYLVNERYIQRINNNDVIIKNNQKIPISRSRIHFVQQKLIEALR